MSRSELVTDLKTGDRFDESLAVFGLLLEIYIFGLSRLELRLTDCAFRDSSPSFSFPFSLLFPSTMENPGVNTELISLFKFLSLATIGMGELERIGVAAPLFGVDELLDLKNGDTELLLIGVILNCKSLSWAKSYEDGSLPLPLASTKLLDDLFIVILPFLLESVLLLVSFKSLEFRSKLGIPLLDPLRELVSGCGNGEFKNAEIDGVDSLCMLEAIVPVPMVGMLLLDLPLFDPLILPIDAPRFSDILVGVTLEEEFDAD